MSTPLEVGDAVWITVDWNSEHSQLYAYNIISIDSDQNVTVAPHYDKTAPNLLVLVNGRWQVYGYSIPHKITFLSHINPIAVGTLFPEKLELIDLRNISLKLFGRLITIANDPEMKNYEIKNYEIWSNEYIRDLITYSHTDTDYVCVHKTILLNDNLIGYIGLRAYREYNNPDDRKFSELSVFLDKNYHRKGYTQKAFNMLKGPFNKTDIMACINPNNQAAIALITRLGFEFYKSIIRKQEPFQCYVKYHEES